MIPVTRQNSVAQKVIEPGFRWVLTLVFVLFALTFVNSAYLLSITLLEYYSGQVYQDYTYLLMFLLHLILGLALLLIGSPHR